MRLFLVAIALFVTTATANAQFKIIDIGVRTGLSVENTKLWSSSKYLGILDAKKRVGLHAGIAARVNLGMFHIQPEVMYSYSSYRIDQHHDPNGHWIPSAGDRESELGILDINNAKVKSHRLDLPVMVGVRLLWFRFQAGPVFSLMTETDMKSDNGYINDFDTSRPYVTYMAGVGFDMGRFSLDVRYHGQFNRTENTVTSSQVLEDKYKSRGDNWQFSLGCFF